MSNAGRAGKRRFYWFSYATNWGRELRRGWLDVHKVRDGGTFVELAAVLTRNRYEYGGLILNLPPHLGTGKEARDVKVPLEPGDLLVLPTRPPLMDRRTQHRRIDKSDTPLERQVFDADFRS